MGRGWDVLRWLGVEEPSEPQEAEVLEAVVSVLDRSDEHRARYVAAFAYLLGRVAAADLHVTDAERSVMARLVAAEADLSRDEAMVVVTLAIDDHRRFGGTHNHLVVREFATRSSPEQRLALLRCLFAVSAADQSVRTPEDNEIRRISRELRLEHVDFIRARLEVREHLAVLRSTAE